MAAMTSGFRKSIGLGKLLRLNLSKRGPFSGNSRTRRLRASWLGAWWQSRRLG
jgi:hypothetical protein